MIIFSHPQNQFSEEDISVLNEYIENGGSVLVMAGEGGDKKSRGNLNEFLSKFGIILNNNSVIRSNYYKYYHPKEVLISNGVIQEDFIRSANGEPKKVKKNKIFVNQMDYEKDPEI